MTTKEIKKLVHDETRAYLKSLSFIEMVNDLNKEMEQLHYVVKHLLDSRTAADLSINSVAQAMKNFQQVCDPAGFARFKDADED